MPAGDGGESAEAAGSGDPRIKLIGSRIRTRINKNLPQADCIPHINSLSAAGFLTFIGTLFYENRNTAVPYAGSGYAKEYGCPSHSLLMER